MKEINPAALQAATEAIYRASGSGVFLVSGIQKQNVMTIGWATTGVLWRKPIFMAVVRPSRYTHALLAEHGEFAVSVPAPFAMKEELAFCGTKSGREVDKVASCGLKLQNAKEISVPVVGGCQQNIECRVLGTSELDLEALDIDLRRQFYKAGPESFGDAHTMYFGEILACYE